MGKRIVPGVIVAAILAFAVAAASISFVPNTPRLWSAAVALVVLGGITPLIYAVNARIVPAFSGRSWQYPLFMYTAMLLAIAGAWTTYIGRALPNEPLEFIGASAALDGGLLFVLSIIWLFRSPKTSNTTPPLPFPEQAAVDRIGTQFMRLAGCFLLLGLIVGFVTVVWTPAGGRWDLVWAHLLLVGWFLSMASGVLYHVLPRWTTARWRHPKLIQAHLISTIIALPLMVAALAFNWYGLFAVAGPAQALSLLLLIWNVAPLIWRLPGITRTSVVAAACFLALGVSLGASVAMDPETHANLRLSHAQINLFGWAGLLICGVGYYLFPRFAGQPLRWPRLARLQVGVHLVAVTVSAIAWWWYYAVDTVIVPLIIASALVMSASFLTFAVLVGLTFRRSGKATTTMMMPTMRPAPRR